MYSAPYGYPNAAGPNFGGAPPPQPGPGPSQPQQQMMYAAQQFPMAAQAPFPGPPNMMAGAGSAALMQNAVMPHLTANGQSEFCPPPARLCLFLVLPPPPLSASFNSPGGAALLDSPGRCRVSPPACDANELAECVDALKTHNLLFLLV